jgi:hypothetical protein
MFLATSVITRLVKIKFDSLEIAKCLQKPNLILTNLVITDVARNIVYIEDINKMFYFIK